MIIYGKDYASLYGRKVGESFCYGEALVKATST